MRDGSAGTRALDRGGQPVESVLQDRFDVAIRARGDGERALAGGFEPLIAVALAEAQDAETGTVALLGVGAIGEDRLDQGAGVGTDALSPAADAFGRPLKVGLM